MSNKHEDEKSINRLKMWNPTHVFFVQDLSIGIYNGNCTEWSAIWSEIKRVITKSHDREAGVRFVITSLISGQNCTTRRAISTL